MSQENSQSQKSTVLEGPLKHVRAAALAAALVPLASIAATPAEAQTMCQSAGICGVVWHDTNNNGIQDTGEGFVEGAVVTLATPMGDRTTWTGANGVYYFERAGRRIRDICSDPSRHTGVAGQ